MKYYAGTTLSQAAYVQQLVAALQSHEWQLTYDWTTHGSLQGTSPARMRAAALAEMAAIMEADCTIIILPGRFGTHCELGAAGVLGKPVYIIDTNGGAFDTASDATNRTVIFYFLPTVVHIDGADLDWARIAQLIVDNQTGMEALLRSASRQRR